MKITESRITMMQKMNGENKPVETRDAGGNAPGTEVVLKIPAYDYKMVLKILRCRFQST